MSLLPGQDGQHITYCRLCEAQCGLIADVENGKITKIGPDRDHPVSRGHLCVKGAGMLNVTYDEDRVTTPLKRVGGPGEFEPVSWDQALSDIVSRLKTVLDTHGANSVGAYMGNPGAFSTMHYAMGGTFLAALNSNKIFNALQVDTGAIMLAAEQVFGHFACFPFPDLPDCDFLMIFGGNPMVSKMSLVTVPRAMHYLEGIHKRGEVIVVDPRNTETAKKFSHQPINPDSDSWLIAAMLRVMIDENLVDKNLLDARVSGWDELAAKLKELDMSAASEYTGISIEQIAEIARKFAGARRAACYGRVGTNRGSFSTLSNMLMSAMNLATGNFGMRGGAVIGETPFTADGHRDPFPETQPGASRIGNLPVMGGAQPGGTMAAEITTPGEGQIRAFFVDSGNPVISYPGGGKMEEALETLDLMVALDFYVTETTKHAHYILPCTTFFERADVNDVWCSNAPEPWLQYVPPVIEPCGDAREEYDVYSEILERMGLADPVSLLTQQERADGAPRPTPIDLTDMRLRGGKYGDRFGERPDGLTLEKLRREHPHGFQYIERMPAERSWEFVHFEDGKPRLWNEMMQSELDRLFDSRPNVTPAQLKLFGRRLLHSMNSWMHNNDRTARNSKATLLMHPEDARDRQISDGQLVSIRSKSGALDVRVEFSEDVVRGSVNYPHGFGHAGGWKTANELEGANINALASNDPADFEQVSGNVHLDGIPVEVAPAPAGATHS